MGRLLAMALAGILALAAGGCAYDMTKDEMAKEEEMRRREQPKDSRGM